MGCELHARSKRAFYKAQDGNRAFYSSAKWQRLRGWFIRRNPVCVHCLHPAEVVDHIIAIKDGGDALNEANLQSLCNRCHQRKRGQESHYTRGGAVKSQGPLVLDRHPSLTDTAAKFEEIFVEIRMGRKPKPSALKLLNGNPGKRPLNPAEPIYEADDELVPPDDLDAEALSEWIRCAPLLRDAGVLTRIDRTALAALCMCYSRWIDAERHVRRDGCVISGSTGSPVMNPYVRVAAQALDQMRALMGDFGMTPSSRGRLRAESTGGGEDDLEKELFG